jgi:histidine triad (HIT) family protein
MTTCIFCGIIASESPGMIVLCNERVTAFRDLHPAAPVHVLIVPNKHIESVNLLTNEDEPLVGRLFTVAKQIAAQEGIAESGYRLITDTNSYFSIRRVVQRIYEEMARVHPLLTRYMKLGRASRRIVLQRCRGGQEKTSEFSKTPRSDL